MPQQPDAITPPAWLILPGHRNAAAHLRIVRYPLWARAWRTAGLATLWSLITTAAFFVTVFDPFLGSIPLIMGGAAVWRSWRGHFRVAAFDGRCPRCGTAMRLDVGVRIRSPHRMVCYSCHHEPQLAILC